MSSKNQNVYLAVVLLHPTPNEADDGVQTKIVVQPFAVVGNDDSQAIMHALKQVPSEYDGKEARLEVRVLPFHCGYA